MKRITSLITLLICFNTTNAQSPINGVLSHTNSYLTINPYNSNYDDGSFTQIFYDENNRLIHFWNSNNEKTFTGLKVENLFSIGKIAIRHTTPIESLYIL
ncbi:hypothetical protein [Aquimarina longa]|uniref:hypothetical protein n=1 Tax=Aquimarina longa TaxID=1080221 RepID=UPI0007863A76|nr:hypothetical protein [Aquimarina longa]